ncbi:amidohydrolase family protein [Novosphingobium bradum]|uniref:Amidohydrolase family protein n=1 Tax=Novosphingobium bradum TaxID=1737444 RepID=A0ABV7IQ09_9SPHN
MTTEVVDRAKFDKAARPDYQVWDVDHHYYEPAEAFLRHLPEKFKNGYRYLSIDGRTKLALNNLIQEFIPNPGFEVVARPGSHENFYRGNNPEGLTLREMGGKPMRSVAAFHNGKAHLELMDELGLHAALVFPTMAVILEERLGHTDPELLIALFHSLNQWVAEEYGFGNGRQYPVGAIAMVDPVRALEELNFLISAGCNAIQVRSAPIRLPLGTISPADPVFDPFWARCAEAKVLVCSHVGDAGYDKLYRDWAGTLASGAREAQPFNKGAMKESFDNMGRPAADFLCTLVCSGVFDRHPGLKVAIVEAGSAWVGPMLDRLRRVYHKLPQEFKKDPVQAIRDHVYIMPFYEDSARHLGELLGMDKVVFGSDWPHPEGMGEPLEYYADIADLTPAEQKMVMCDNLKDLMEGRW